LNGILNSTACPVFLPHDWRRHLGNEKDKFTERLFSGRKVHWPWISAWLRHNHFSAVAFIGFAGKLGWVFGLNTMWIVAGNALIGGLGAWLILGRAQG
jgi:hypothetical protein